MNNLENLLKKIKLSDFNRVIRNMNLQIKKNHISMNDNVNIKNGFTYHFYRLALAYYEFDSEYTKDYTAVNFLSDLNEKGLNLVIDTINKKSSYDVLERVSPKTFLQSFDLSEYNDHRNKLAEFYNL